MSDKKVKKYPVLCQGGCRRTVATVALPEDVALDTQHQGYLCEDCARKQTSEEAGAAPSQASA